MAQRYKARTEAEGQRGGVNEAHAETELKERLRRAAAMVRIRSLEMVHHAKLGHPGGDLSSADVLVTLYLAVMRIDPANPRWAERDRFIMSKGHCSGAFYATLAQAGLIAAESLDTYMDPL